MSRNHLGCLKRIGIHTFSMDLLNTTDKNGVKTVLAIFRNLVGILSTFRALPLFKYSIPHITSTDVGYLPTWSDHDMLVVRCHQAG